jgi:Tol biopolymer transport system component
MRLTAQGLGCHLAFAVGLVAALLFAAGAATAPAAPGNGASGNAAITADGRFVAFASDASDLVAGDTNKVSDVFVRDRSRRTTERVSLGPDGVQANARTGLSAISADGRFVVMWSDASNLVPGDTNGVPDIFVRDRVAKTTERVSVATAGAQANGESAQGVISSGGRFVAFASTASNLPGGGTTPGFDVFVHDRDTGKTEQIGDGWIPALSADARYVAFAARSGRILVRDRALGETEDVSVATDGAPLPGTGSVPTITADGRFVAFLMVEQTTPRDRRMLLYVRDRSRRTTVRVDVANPGNPSISADGRFVAFSDGGVFVRDLLAGTTELASTARGGVPGNGSSYTGSGPLSADGRFVAFFSLASNLDPSDTNGANDVFVRDRRVGTTELVSVARSRLVAERLTMLPKHPVSGRLFTVTLRVTGDDGPVPRATVRCAARIGGRALPVVAVRFRSSSARCSWRPPLRSHHTRLSGSISVSTAYGSVERAFAVLVR